MHLKPLSKKKEPCFARGRGAEEGRGWGTGSGSEPDQSSVCNNRSVEADDRLRQSASRAEWALQPGLSTSATTTEEMEWEGEGWPGTGWRSGGRSTIVWWGRAVRLKIIQLNFSTWFSVVRHQCNAGHFELCAVLAQHSIPLQGVFFCCCLFQMGIRSLLGENGRLGKILKKLNGH